MTFSTDDYLAVSQLLVDLLIWTTIAAVVHHMLARLDF